NGELEDRWIVSRLNRTVEKLRDAMGRFRVNESARTLYEFVWHDFCDWYVELIKERLSSGDARKRRDALACAFDVFDAILRLLHPFMPFLTEELWHRVGEAREERSILQELLPEADPARIDEDAEDEMEYLQGLVESIRGIRGEMNVPPSKTCTVVIRCHDVRRRDAILRNAHFLERLARIGDVEAGETAERPPLSAAAVVMGDEVYVPLEGLIDITAERKRLDKEIRRLEGVLSGIAAKLSNEKFMSSAPPDVVERERAKEQNVRSTLEKLRRNLAGLETG
ncbi:MAG: class I tRNA ligase family protein, partial [Bacteroidota bacterium]|nr:class I tRNA ligase family protein [Bacteroidota bacterium]